MAQVTISEAARRVGRGVEEIQLIEQRELNSTQYKDQKYVLEAKERLLIAQSELNFTRYEGGLWEDYMTALSDSLKGNYLTFNQYMALLLHHLLSETMTEINDLPMPPPTSEI
jgi:hypothetical protein